MSTEPPPPLTPDVGVRPARAEDAPAVAAVQRVLWEQVYAPMFPPSAAVAALLALEAGDPERAWADAARPSARHHLLVATAAGTVVGYATFGPALDDDLDPATDAEVASLAVTPELRGAGHGSRLLAATADLLRTDGAQHAVTWLFDADAETLAFLEAAGWAVDGARRELEIGRDRVPQLRLHTDLRSTP